jgi:hypothetical protein
LDSTRSFDDVALHIGRQISKVRCIPCLLTVFAEGSLERVIIGAVIIGGHDVFSSMKVGCQSFGPTDTTNPTESVGDACGQFLDLAIEIIQPLSSQRQVLANDQACALSTFGTAIVIVKTKIQEGKNVESSQTCLIGSGLDPR